MLQEVQQKILRGYLPSREELRAIPMSALRNLDIKTVDQMNLVQEVVNERLQNEPLEIKIDNSDVERKMDREINRMTPEKEAVYQKTIDERVQAVKPKLPTDEKIKEASTILEIIQEEIKTEEGEIEKVKTEQPVKRFCEFCDSRGFRHKSKCTRPKLNKDEHSTQDITNIRQD